MQNKRVIYITQAAIIAAMYSVLTIGQNALLPGTASAAVQFRVFQELPFAMSKSVLFGHKITPFSAKRKRIPLKLTRFSFFFTIENIADSLQHSFSFIRMSRNIQ